jgi:hypothetical protein
VRDKSDGRWAYRLADFHLNDESELVILGICKGLPKAPAQPMVPHYGPFLSSEYAAR